jgi:hypothetical protein
LRPTNVDVDVDVVVVLDLVVVAVVCLYGSARVQAHDYDSD